MQDAARRQLAEMRLFVADVERASEPIGLGQGEEEQRRARQRLEAAIMAHLYAAPAPFCDLPD